VWAQSLERGSVGQPIGSRYELEEQLGRGAFGSVWRARVRETGEAVAVKVLLEELANDAEVVTRFLRERTALLSLRHRSLVSVRDLVVEGDVLALVMQLVEGPDLRVYVRGRGTLGPEEAALLVADVADALAVAHRAKIIHRDVKPANVLLQPEAGGFRPLLTDFGIARLADAPSVTRTSQVVGTPYYLAPEVISGQQPTSAVDVYASGIMLYELLTGHPPFRGRDSMEVFHAHQRAVPQRPPGLADPLWAVALDALGKDPARRPSADQLAAALRAAVRVRKDGTIASLPVHAIEGTVVLPALAAEMKIAAGAGQGGGAVALPGRPTDAAALAPTYPLSLPPVPRGPIAPSAPSRGAAASPAMGPPAQSPVRPQPAAPPAGNQGNQRPGQQRYVQPPYAAQQQPQSAQRQQYPPQPAATQRPGSRPPVNQAPQHLAQRPSQQYAPPRTQAPRYPEPVRSGGLGLFGKIVILLIVLAVAVAAGVGIGRYLHNHAVHSAGRSLGTDIGQSVGRLLAEVRDIPGAPAR
jgi:serine/threonine protein kinase, bacterial